MKRFAGPLALVGGAEFMPAAAPLDAWLLERSGSSVVTVIPTAARAHPEMAVATARRHFNTLGASVEGAMVLARADADSAGARAALAAARFIYLAGGDPGYLYSVLRGSAAWSGVLDALAAGAVLAGSSAGAMVLCDLMLLPVAARPTPGLGLVEGVVVLAHHDRWRERVGSLAGRLPVGARLLGIDEATGLVIDGEDCHVLGAGSVTLYAGGAPVWSQAAPGRLSGCL